MTETAPNVPTDVQVSARVYVDAQQHPDDARQTAVMALRTVARDAGLLLVESTAQETERTAILMVGDSGEWTVAPHRQKADGWMTVWVAETQPPVRDDVTAALIGQHGQSLEFAIPGEAVPTGGGVRVRHRIGGPVTVHAWSGERLPLPLQFSQPLSEDEEHVEVHPGTAFLTVVPDPV